MFYRRHSDHAASHDDQSTVFRFSDVIEEDAPIILRVEWGERGLLVETRISKLDNDKFCQRMAGELRSNETTYYEEKQNH
jgi:hypothetical protein